jgi:hypothetical protein
MPQDVDKDALHAPARTASESGNREEMSGLFRSSNELVFGLRNVKGQVPFVDLFTTGRFAPLIAKQVSQAGYNDIAKLYADDPVKRDHLKRTIKVEKRIHMRFEGLVFKLRPDGRVDINAIGRLREIQIRPIRLSDLERATEETPLRIEIPPTGKYGITGSGFMELYIDQSRSENPPELKITTATGSFSAGPINEDKTVSDLPLTGTLAGPTFQVERKPVQKLFQSENE